VSSAEILRLKREVIHYRGWLEQIRTCEPDPGVNDVDADRQLDACIDLMHDYARDALEGIEP
jgi:hypothetical protein